MTTEPTTTPPADERRDGDASIVRKLSTLDRYLAVWILLAMAVGLGLGRMIPGMNDALAKIEVGGISLPIALGLLVMMYPVLAKVRYDRLDTVTGDRRLMVSSLVINWLVGPAVMFALAWVFLPDLPEYRTGLIIVGLARCIAMVIIWNDLACGDREAAAVLVALNSVFQVLVFGVLGWFYLDLLPRWLGLGDGQGLDVPVWHIALNVIVFLGVPLLAGFLTRRIGEKRMGRESYEAKFLPRIGPWALYGLLFTIVVLFALQGRTITSQPLDVVRIALPLLVYFAIMFFGSFLLGKALGLAYDRTATLAFTAAGNNFELAIAVAIATFGVTSGQALSGVVGPLIEVPVLIGLVYVALAWRGKFAPGALDTRGPRLSTDRARS
ncbi:ACR3 family arsenite efflux transporter [Streptomyces tsukubensis]|uniref:Arsenical-resistance protein n=1 Tax=Streptomyces tsukubensis TaxID=83656 RepID=A0A1V4A277_9ACTN|nr:ACR3 family arsenite efflux transporter [Streptomyces tsukubensis]OON72711.1 arsenical-resistance protein [Streptomyces tsukubensis]QFR96801.1 ACR3 family arsenite efflux transporter [Streptomyces tsukubensis]